MYAFHELLNYSGSPRATVRNTFKHLGFSLNTWDWCLSPSGILQEYLGITVPSISKKQLLGVLWVLPFLRTVFTALMLLQADLTHGCPCLKGNRLASLYIKLNIAAPGCLLFLSCLVLLWMEKIFWLSGQACKMLALALVWPTHGKIWESLK